MAQVRTKIDVKNFVISFGGESPLLGKYATGITWTPWKWDERAWTSEQDENSYQYVPSLCDPSYEDIESLNWQSGVGNLSEDLELLRIDKIRENGEDRWVPIVRHGTYYRYNSPRYLFADGFDTIYFANATQTEIQLLTIPKNTSPISVILWERDVYKNPTPYLTCHKMTSLSVATWKDQFMVDWGTPANYDIPPKLVFTRNMTKTIGLEPSVSGDLIMLEKLGTIFEGTVLELQYFPVVASSVHIWTSEAEEFFDFGLDADKGEIIFREGVFGTFYASYTATPSIRYESIRCGDSASLPNMNLDPFGGSTNQGFVYLTEEDLRAYSIQLTSSSRDVNLGGDYSYLTVFVGSYSGLPVYGVEVTFSFVGEEGGLGYLNGADEITVTTNARGEATVVYTTPRSLEAISQYTAEVCGTVGGANTGLHLKSINGLNNDPDSLASISLFEVFDDTQLPVSDLLSYTPWTASTADPFNPMVPGYGGRKVLIMEQRDDYLIYPVRPVSFEIDNGKGLLSFNVPLNNIENGRVAYWVTGGKKAKIQASCFSYVYNRTITTGIMSIGLTIPDHMKGTYISNEKEIPLGWRLFDGTLSGAASALDGTVYIYPKNWIKHTFKVTVP